MVPECAWDDAHTDYGAHSLVAPPGPGGLARSDAEWRSHLQETPNGWLLGRGSLIETLTSGRPIYLMHTTTYLDAIRASRQLYQAAGCLVGALYCAPLAAEPEGLRPHNLGSFLLETKPDTRVLVFEVDPGRPVPATGINYLRLGRIHLETSLEHQDFLTGDEIAWLHQRVTGRIRRVAAFLDLTLANACGTTRTRAGEFVDRLAAAVPTVPFLGYLYFEVLAEYLMLHSTSPRTKAAAEVGELNNRLYKRLAFAAVPTMGRLFDLALFRPARERLEDLVSQIEPGLAATAAAYTRDRLPHLFACAALAPGQNIASATFQDAHLDQLAPAALFDRYTTTAPGLLGQMVFRQLRTSPRYPQLFAVFEQAKATAVSAYWNRRHIPTPFNGVIPKGEIGLNLAWPPGARAWVAEICERGLLHPVEPLEVTLVPRLSDLRGTALGRARFPAPSHPSPPQPDVPSHL